MTKDEMQMLGFEIVAYAGEAKSTLMRSLSKALDGEYQEAKTLFDEAQESLTEAHNSQMQLLSKEAQGEELPYSLTMVHGQDHLTGAVLLRDVLELIISKKL